MREENIQKRLQSSNYSCNEAVVKIMGNLGRMPNGQRVESEFVSTPVRLGDLLDFLQKKYSLDLRRDSALITINGVEARALSDLETSVESGDEVVFIPMFHGG